MIENSEIIISGSQIDTRCKELGEQISSDYQGKDLVVLGVLNGAFMFTAQLCKNITIDMSVDFIQVSSYKGETLTSESVTLLREPRILLSGKDILIVEDIVDTGITTAWLKTYFSKRNVRSYNVCTLVNKCERRFIETPVTYSGFLVERGFLIGYGLDYQEKYRNLPDIYCANV